MYIHISVPITKEYADVDSLLGHFLTGTTDSTYIGYAMISLERSGTDSGHNGNTKYESK